MASPALEAFAPVMLRPERINQMGLQQQPDTFRAEFARTAANRHHAGWRQHSLKETP
jgi:hypothetical protein